MIEDLNCPHCGNWNEEPDECYEQEEVYFCECKHCNQTFGFTFSFFKSFTEFQTPCQNEDDSGNYLPHKWKKIIGAPKEYFKGKYQCAYCNDQTFFTDDQIKELNLEV